jgi:hypothetical protein
MKNISAPIKGMVLAVSIAALSMTGNAQAHSDFDYSVPAQLLLFNALLQPHYDRGHDHRYKSQIRHNSYGHNGRHHHGHNRGGHGKGYYKPRKHSHSYGGYREKRLVKERYRY